MSFADERAPCPRQLVAYGDRFMIVEAPSELVLLPVPDDAVDDLAELGRRLPKTSMKQLRAQYEAFPQAAGFNSACCA